MNKLRFVALFLLLSTSALTVGVLIASANPRTPVVDRTPQDLQQRAVNKLSAWVLDKTANGEQAEFLVILADQADLSAAEDLQTKEEKGRYVFETLRAKAGESQASLLDWLVQNNIEHKSFYIVNAVLVNSTREVALELAARTDVARIEGNPQLQGIKPITSPEKNNNLNLTAAIDEIETGVKFIRATEIWSMGFTGHGIVIGSQDTGVKWDHPALISQYRGWTGAGGNHDYNWHDSIHSGGGDCGPNSKVPCDDQNHGTHTLGTAVGSDAGLNHIGVAPGAKFIACRNMDRGNGTPATYLECFQFFLAPYPVNGTPVQGDPSKAPDITTNSWGCPPSEGCSPGTLKNAVEAQRAAGIMTIVAAGNEGAGCSTVVDPPATYDASYSVGSINAMTGNISAFSSRGPVTIDGSNRIKPDITAPGELVRSALRNGGYGLLSGTSMATPHVAGAVALLWSAYPDLKGQIAVTENILNESAARIEVTDCRSKGFPNNLYGFGRLDIKAAFDLAATKLAPTEQVFGIRGGTGKIEVSAFTDVAWRASSNDPWIVITGGEKGSGQGVVTFTVDQNTDPARRVGTLTIAGRPVKITQAGAAPLYAVSGRVTASDGAGISRAAIRFSHIAGGGDVPDTVYTDDRGNWSQSGFEPGTTYSVTASRSRMTFRPSSQEFNAPGSALNFTSVSRRILMLVDGLK